MRLAAKWRTDWRWEVDLGPEAAQFYPIGGERVDVVRMGRGRPLVMLPGLAGGWKLVGPLARRLSRHFEVYVCGLRGDSDPGTGLEGGPGVPWDLSEYAHDLRDLLDRLDLGAPAILGVSFGGAIALQYAIEYPRGLESLMVYGADSRFQTSIGSKIARRVLERYHLPTDSPFVNQFLNLLYGKKPEPGPVVDFVTRRIWETSQGVMARRLAQLESFDISEQLWRIDVPTLVQAGERDVIVPAARQKVLAESIPGARFRPVAEAGHIGFLTHQNEIVRSVRRHLAHSGAVV